MIDTPSLDAFLAATLRGFGAGETPPWPGENPAWSDTETLALAWDRIEFHGIAVLLRINASKLASWPKKLRERIAEQARLMGLWEATHARAVAKMIQQLETAGVASVLMKGTALAYSIYDEPAARSRGDTDLLIAPSDLETTRAILIANGWYRKDPIHGLYFQESWLIKMAGSFVHSIDLHWQASDRPLIREILPNKDFFQHRLPLPRLDKHAFRADPALTIIQCMFNQKWHVLHGYSTQDANVKGSRRLIWSMDFDLLVRTMDDTDWTRLVDLSAQRQIGQLVAEALRDARTDLETPLPQKIIEELESITTLGDLDRHFLETDTLSEFWIDLRTATGWRERYRLIIGRGFPPRDHLVQKYPDKRNWPTLLLQFRLLTETARRIVRRMTPK